MNTEPSTIERALQLARSGPCRSVADIRQQLTQERHVAVQGHLSSGSLIVKQLKKLLSERQR